MSNATWNHRVLVFTEPSDGSHWYAIHEVHYLDGKPEMYTENPTPVASESIEGLRATLLRMLRCLDHPALKETDFALGSDMELESADGPFHTAEDLERALKELK